MPPKKKIAPSFDFTDIDKLIPYANNSRTHSEDQIKQLQASLREFGFVNPVLVDDNMTIIAGHGRVEAAKREGIKNIPTVKISHLTKGQLKAYIIADNRLALNAGWNDELLKIELEDLKALDFDIDLLGFDEKELDDLVGKKKSEGLTDDDEVPEVEENIHNVKRGDIWQLGNHRLMCGDSTCLETVRMLMNGEKADMVFTDPPYGINFSNDSLPKKDFKGVREGLKHNKYKLIEGDFSDYDPSFILEHFADCGEIFIWGYNNYADKLPKSTLIVWDRKLNESADKNLVGDFDICWSKKKHKMAMCRIPWFGVFGHSKVDDGNTKVHPTQKPVKLAEWFFDRWGNDKNKVADIFLGSGSTLIACEKTGRKCYGMEIDPHYCSVIIERWQNYTGLEAKCVVR